MDVITEDLQTMRGKKFVNGGAIMDQAAFEQAKMKVLLREYDPKGFGTLQEKTVHAVMKNYYDSDAAHQEIMLAGFIADIFDGEQVIEIQNGNFRKMREKLAAFLPLFPVLLVYPIPHEKWVIWLDEKTGELSQKHKSPVHGSAYSAFYELYQIRDFLKDPHLSFAFPLVDMDEYRLLNGRGKNKKKGSSRYDRMPLSLYDEIRIDDWRDFMSLIPYDLPEHFTNKEFAAAAGIHTDESSETLGIFSYLGLVHRVGKRGRAYEYEVDNTWE